jgi:prolyl oligopeptidase
VEVKETLHGVELTDPYRWLEDQNSPQTRAWLEAQIAYTRRTLAPLPGREALQKRLAEILKVDSMSAPVKAGDWYFYSRRKVGQDQFVLYRRKGLKGKEEVVLDPNPLSDDHSISFSVNFYSNDGSLMIYGLRQGGADEVELRVRNLISGRDLPDKLPTARYSGSELHPDGRRLYYSKMTPNGPRVYLHTMGTDISADRELFGEGYDIGKIISLQSSRNGRYVIATVSYGSSGTKTDIYALNTEDGTPFRPIVTDLPGRFSPRVAGDQLVVHTNWLAPNGRVLRIDLRNPSRSSWKEIVPETDAALTGFSLAHGSVCLNYLKDVKSRVQIVSLDGKPIREIAFPTIGTVSSINGDVEEREAFFSFSSFHIPATIFRYDMETGRRDIWARSRSKVDSDALVTRQVWYTSKDGTKVPMFLVHRRDLKPDGSRPVYLTGYGGFNLSQTPQFSATATIIAESGGVFALPNLRGGGEFGEPWHQAGMRGKKQNTFDDFIAAAEYLIREGVTNPSKIAISGGSNGGLLVGAAMTQRPDLFRAVLCSVPLLDMVRFHLFLVARFWVPEYGSSEDAEQFRTLLAYSPYHNVKPGTAYPAVMFITGDADTRVAPLHARKMAALMQYANSGKNPVLLHYDVKAGHSAGLPVGKVIEDQTDALSFVFWQLGAAPLERGHVQ